MKAENVRVGRVKLGRVRLERVTHMDNGSSTMPNIRMYVH